MDPTKRIVLFLSSAKVTKTTCSLLGCFLLHHRVIIDIKNMIKTYRVYYIFMQIIKFRFWN